MSEVEFNEVENLPIAEEEGQVCFNTAILTYPSTFNGFLSVGIITEFLEKKFGKKKVKVVIAREDADEKIQRTHFHVYIDGSRQLKVRPRKYFDIKLPNKLVVLVGYDTKRKYKDYSTLESELGWDNFEEMAAKLSSYCEKYGYKNFEVLEWCHPNLQVKKRYGSKYQMLRYVVKQGLVARSNFDIRKELAYLKTNEDKLRKRMKKLQEEKTICVNGELEIVDELLELCEDYIRKTLNQTKKNGKIEYEFNCWLRRRIVEDKLTDTEVINEINQSDEKFNIYAKNYLNYKKMIEDTFKKLTNRPEVDYETHSHWWLPRKLYNYLMWLDQWVMKWTTGTLTKEDCKDRIKSLVIIGPTRTGKTELMLQFGYCSYMANVWMMDQWINKASYTVMDDIDPNTNNPEKGLNFTWFKGFFGGQKTVGMTDKYRTKKLVTNGKPLIWLSNNELEVIFPRPVDIDYIEKNSIIIRLNRPLYEKPDPVEWIEGHSDYVEFDTKNTWYYQNVILPNTLSESIPTTTTSTDTENLLKEIEEEIEENEPLVERKQRLKRSLSWSGEAREKFEKDKGRLLCTLEEKIEKIQYLLNEEEGQKNKLEIELDRINLEYSHSKNVVCTNKELVNYQQVLMDKSLELCNSINYSLVKLDKYKELKELFCNCYYFVDKSVYE